MPSPHPLFHLGFTQAIFQFITMVHSVWNECLLQILQTSSGDICPGGIDCGQQGQSSPGMGFLRIIGYPSDSDFPHSRVQS